MKEEDEIRKKCGTNNPFNVPEDYFRNFTNEIMDKLPEKEEFTEQVPVSVWGRIKPWFYMAAMFAGILLSIRFMIESSTDKENIASVASVAESEYLADEYIDAIMDHSMMDDYTLYEYLTEADTDGSFN